MNTEELNTLAKRVHKANEKWWQNPTTGEPVIRNKHELMMLMITELAEACEGERKNLMDDKLPNRKMAEVEMADTCIRIFDYAGAYDIGLIGDTETIKNGIDDISSVPENKGESLFMLCASLGQYAFRNVTEAHVLSMTIFMIRQYCIKYDYDLWGTLEEKLAYNATREDHSHEARLQAGGKKW